MNDAIRYRYLNFDANASNNHFFVPTHMAQVWSVQMIVKTAFTAANIELLMSNDGETGVVFAVAQEFTAAGLKTGIDCGGLGFSHLGVRVKTAASSGEKVDFWIVGRNDYRSTGEMKTIEVPTKA